MNIHEVAIVGGAGFVGSRLAHRFNKANICFNKYDIDLSTKSDRTIFLDVEDVLSLDQLSNASTIINLAAVHRDDVRPLSRYDDVNVQGARNICEAASKYAINKIIFTSSVAIYGFAPSDTHNTVINF
jgi:GlcNAc-P-P-Und epimerase